MSTPMQSGPADPAQQKKKETFSGKVLPPPELPYTVGPDQDAYYTLYRRPNDDSFQNGGDPSKPGTPFQVGWMWCSIVASKNSDGTLKSLDFRWDFENITGRHSEAPEYFKLRESRNSLDGETAPVDYPDRARDKMEKGMADVKTKYPEGVTAASPTNLKRGTRSSTMLTIINAGQTPLKDGDYSGDLEVRINPALYKQADKLEGLEQVANSGGPKNGVYKKLDWKIKVVGGKIVEEDVNCTRFNKNQPLQVAANNVGKPSPFEKTGYPEQTPAAECKSDTENVGEGDLPEDESVQQKADRLTRRVGKVIANVGCLNCHGDGTEDNFRFCDDGRPLRASEDAFKLYSMMMTGVPHRPTPPQYPAGMIQSMMEFRAQMLADKDGSGLRGSFREWVESQKTEAKIIEVGKEQAALEKAQAADQEKLTAIQDAIKAKK